MHAMPLTVAGAGLLSLALAVLPAADAVSRKCGSAADPVIAIDGRVMAKDSPRVRALMDSGKVALEPTAEPALRDSIYAVEIVCMNPADSTFPSRVGVPVISIWTQAGPLPRRLPALERVRDAQLAHWGRHGSFAPSLKALDIQAAPAGVAVTVEGNERGWIAAARVRNTNEVCYLYDGAWEAPHEAVLPGEARCVRLPLTPPDAGSRR